MSTLDPAQQAARDQFDRQSDRYGKTHILADTSDVAAALDGIQVPEGAALDVATGGGHTAVYLARQGRRVVASDVSPAMLRNATRLAGDAGVRLTVAEHTAEDLPYRDGAFALVTCRVAAHHFSDQAGFVREAARVLEPGGIFLLIDGSVPDDNPEAEAWAHEVEKLRDPSHGRLLSPSSWRRLCTVAGLAVERCVELPLKQPDLGWYFETANTPPANREKVRELVRNAPASAREAFRITVEEGRTVWWWMRVLLVARKPDGSHADHSTGNSSATD